MKNKNLLIIVLAALAAWYFLVYRKKQKQTNTNTNNTQLLLGVPASPWTSISPIPETPSADEVMTKTETGDCPYCGTRNAVIKRHILNGKVIKMEVLCGNKSCPGPTGGNVQVINSIKSNKFVVDR